MKTIKGYYYMTGIGGWFFKEYHEVKEIKGIFYGKNFESNYPPDEII